MKGLSASPTVMYEYEDPDLKYTPGRPSPAKINRYAPRPDLGSFYFDLSSRGAGSRELLGQDKGKMVLLIVKEKCQ